MFELISTFITGLSVTGVAVWTFSSQLANRIINKKLDENTIEFTQKLKDKSADIRAEHEKEMQAINHDLHNEKHRYSLYTNKRHDVYPEIYSKILEAISPAVAVLSYSYNYTLYSEQQIMERFGSKVASMELEEIIEVRKVDIAEGNKMLNKLNDGILHNEFYDKVSDANNSLLKAELYFEEETYNVASEIMAKAYDVWTIKDTQKEGYRDLELTKEFREARKYIRDNRDNLKELMKRDLQKV